MTKINYERILEEKMGWLGEPNIDVYHVNDIVEAMKEAVRVAVPLILDKAEYGFLEQKIIKELGL